MNRMYFPYVDYFGYPMPAQAHRSNLWREFAIEMMKRRK